MNAPKLLIAALLAVSCLATLGACSKQTEGERCDIDAGVEGDDSDCDDGLECVSSQELGTSSDICCPKEGATDAACTGALGSSSSSASSSASSSSAGGAGGTGGAGGAGGAGGTTSSGGAGGAGGAGGN
jgi:hypothetical protein